MQLSVIIQMYTSLEISKIICIKYSLIWQLVKRFEYLLSTFLIGTNVRRKQIIYFKKLLIQL